MNNIVEFIKKQNSLSTLRYITCGSVDDGKSTLLGRMLYEAQLIFDDQVDNLVKDSKRIGTQGEKIDFALLVDGLAAEREQGITIDVAYRFFSTKKRKFIVADSPGHEQYTRNMVTAASNAELAIILIDARNGILPQTKRHSFIANLMGIKNIIVAINKMDLVNFNKDIFNSIVDDYKKNIESQLSFSKVIFIPVSALEGDNITSNSSKTPWYKGKPLMKILESIKIGNETSNYFTMPVQYVNRPNLDFRGFSGTISSGKIQSGDLINEPLTNQKAQIKEILIGDRKVKEATEGDAVTVTINKEIDISRGNILVGKDSEIQKSNGFLVSLIWFDIDECYQNRTYILKTANRMVNCEIVKIKNKININNFEKISGSSLSMNDIGNCEILTDQEIFLQPYQDNKTLGNFILVDKKTNLTVAAGVNLHNLRRSTNISWQKTEVGAESRKRILGQKPLILWFTGLSGAGKSTIANIVEKKLSLQNKLTYLLDGDNLRHGLNKDLGFKNEDRIENLRRVGEVAKILHDAGIIVLASFISPFTRDRENIRSLFPENEFLEIYIKASIGSVTKRDPKGLYKKALQGDIPNFTGISSDYEEPKNPEILIDTDNVNPQEAAKIILEYLSKNNVS